MQVVIETPGYLSDAKDVGLTEDERQIIVDFVAENPDAGIEIKGRAGGEKANLSQAERNELKEVLGSIAEIYREGVKRHVKSRK